MPPKAKATATATADGDAADVAVGGAAPGGRTLVIVESPAKAKTIQGYLGPGYDVEASVGHIRDLPKRAADIPAKYKGEAWSRLGVDVDHGYTALYVVDNDKRTKVAELKKKLAQADTLLLATDEDREGEAIAWHLLEVLAPTVPVKRMVFHEITRDAIRRTGTLGSSTCRRCHAMASPSRSSSVASRRVSAAASFFFSSATFVRLSASTT